MQMCVTGYTLHNVYGNALYLLYARDDICITSH